MKKPGQVMTGLSFIMIFSKVDYYSPNTTSTATVEARTAMSSLGYTVSSSVQNYENENFLPALQNNNLV